MSPRRGRPINFTEMNTSNTGHGNGRQNHSINFKKKSDSEEDDKEEEEEEEEEEDNEEEEEIPTVFDIKEDSHVYIGTVACDHSKQGIESEIPPENQNDAESEVTDGSENSKKTLDKSEVCHIKFDIDANDQTNPGLEPEIGTEIQHAPESGLTKDSDTSTNKPGNSIVSEVISPGEGGPDDNSDGPTVLQSHPPLRGKALLYQQYLESKQNDGPEQEIGTENQHEPESEVAKGGDTSTHKPGDSIGTEVISQGVSCSDGNSDGHKVLQSNRPFSGKALLYQQYLELKQNDTTMNVPGDL
jgi:hypothetical protein